VQGSADLLPSDVTGVSVFEPSNGTWTFRPGPVFNNVVLFDELNRATPRTQSALLEAMAEGQATVDGTTRALPEPFFVVATQNPIESEGVYQLPDAQRDRFMMKITLDYPTPDEEMMIIDRMSIEAPLADQVITLDQLSALQAQADRVFVDRSVSQYAVDLVQCTRTPDKFGLGDLSSVIGLGASPRASLNLVRGARAIAMLRGRTYATPQDVFDLAPEILRHRLLLTYDALARDITTDHVIQRMLSTVPAAWV
jgi:MoxR-like ATPase